MEIYSDNNRKERLDERLNEIVTSVRDHPRHSVTNRERQLWPSLSTVLSNTKLAFPAIRRQA